MKQRNRKIRGAVLAAILLASQATSVLADGLERVLRFDIPAQSTQSALLRFSEQTNLQVVVDETRVVNKTSAAVKGDLPLNRALTLLLQGTGLEFDIVNEHTIAIVPVGQRTSADTSAEDADSANFRGVAEILVVGSKLLNVDLKRSEDDAQPYQVIQGEKIVQSGVFNMEDFFRQQLTANTSIETNRGSSSGRVSGATAKALTLRGLNTLVLVNGHRTAGTAIFGASTAPFDYNALPPSVLERVEVLPASASAIYGGDAIGGVVNFVLKRSFEGGELRMNYDSPLDTSAPQRSVQGAYGWSMEEGRTNFMVSGSYADSQAVQVRDRPEFVQRAANQYLKNMPSLLITQPIGSTPNISSANLSNLVLDDGTALGSPYTYLPAGYTANSNPQSLLANAGLFNTALRNGTSSRTGLLSPMGADDVKIKSLVATMNRQMTDRLEFISEFFYTSNDSSTLQDQMSSSYTIAGNAPSNPFQQSVVVQLPSGDPALLETDSDSRRLVAGLIFDLTHGWRAQGDYTWNKSRASMASQWGSNGAVERGIANGDINVFVDPAVSPLNLSAYRMPWTSTGESSLKDMALRASGPLWTLPGGPINLTVGLGHRREAYEGGTISRTSTMYPDLDSVQVYRPQTQKVFSVYAESFVPIVSKQNSLPGLQALDLQLAVRREDFSVDSATAFYFTSSPALVGFNQALVESTVDYKSTNVTVGLRYQPIDSLLLRASYATGFVPPGYTDLLPGSIATYRTGGLDPLRGNEPYIAQVLQGGNPSLKPMESKNWNLGLIFEPAFLDGLRVGFDWYRIDRANLAYAFYPNIGNDILGRVTRATPAPGDPYGVGPITQVDWTLVSSAKALTEGYDVSLGYLWRTDNLGVFNFNLQETVITKFNRQNVATRLYEDRLGLDVLRARASFNASWELDRWTTTWSASYYSSYPLDPSIYNQNVIIAQGSSSVPSQVYHNLTVGYVFPGVVEGFGGSSAANLLSDLSVTVGIRNVFDKAPPMDLQQTWNYWASPLGDNRLRSIWISLGKRF